MTLSDALTRYTLLSQRRATRPFLRFSVVTPANDTRCSGCGQVHCNCPDPIWSGAVPPSAA